MSGTGRGEITSVEITSSNRTAGVSRRALRAPRRAKIEKAFVAAARLAGANGRLTVHLAWLADREMRAIKRRFTGRGGTTDVLAFEESGMDPESRRRRLGEIVCNLELAGREVARYGHTREAEAVLYATHGLLHLLGGRDETPAERRRMRTAELGALRAAGLRVRGGEWEETRQRQRITAKSAKDAKYGHGERPF